MVFPYRLTTFKYRWSRSQQRH